MLSLKPACPHFPVSTTQIPRPHHPGWHFCPILDSPPSTPTSTPIDLLSLLLFPQLSSPPALIIMPASPVQASLVAQMVKNLPATQETQVQSLGWEAPQEEGLATHSSIVAWRIPMDRGAWRAAAHGVPRLGHN